MGTVKLVRNPHPVPDLSREGRWSAGGPVLGQNVCSEERRWYSKVEPHERLFSHQTLTSARRDCRYKSNEAMVPKDSLDLMLSSVYIHNKDLFLPKTYVMMQPETLDKETWRVLRNEIKVYSKPPVPLGHEIKYADTEPKRSPAARAGGLKDQPRKKIHPSSLQLAIEGPHTDRTNPGYSRKIDGTYYGI